MDLKYGLKKVLKYTYTVKKRRREAAIFFSCDDREVIYLVLRVGVIRPVRFIFIDIVLRDYGRTYQR